MILRTLRRKKLYLALVAVRLVVALTSTATIHPDEHFQNPEIAAGLVFDYGTRGEGTLRSWEWLGEQPCRSIGPVWGSVGAAFELLRLVGADAPSARVLFLVQRLCMWALSLVIDCILALSCESEIPLFLFATSPITFTFLLRPFSNSLETLLFAFAFLLLSKIIKTDRRMPVGWTTTLGGTLVLGVFTRVTFVAFAAPLVGAFILSAVRKLSSRQLSWAQWTFAVGLQGVPAVFGFLGTTLVLALLDTLHFSHTSPSTLLSKGIPSLIFTPINSFLFNLSTSNLAAHGIHPRYLHLLVNWPMLLGVGLWGVADVFQTLWTKNFTSPTAGTGAFMQRVYLAAFIIPTAILSILPHQEPRFLVPLIIPLVLLLQDSTFFNARTLEARAHRRHFWFGWIGHTLIFTLLFGYLHQGGLVPALLALNHELRTPGIPFLKSPINTTSVVEIVFWRTFMPPRHLLLPIPDPLDQFPLPSFHITDLAGATPSVLSSTLADVSHPGSSTILVAPAWAFDRLPLSARQSCSRELFDRTFGVHLDMDHLGDLGTAWGMMGVGAWEIRGDCRWGV